VSIYVDANVVVALFIEDSMSQRAHEIVAGLSDAIVVSDLTALEFVSAVARRARAKDIGAKAAAEAIADFDFWAAAVARIDTEASDLAQADRLVRRFEINLHSADAIHVAIATRLGASLLTLDSKMKASAKKLGLAVV
jgi:predicted nucleic acid-binding protein